MGTPKLYSFVMELDEKLGAVSDVPVGRTKTVGVVMSPVRLWAAALTLTANVCALVIFPVNASVSVAAKDPLAPPDICEIDRFGIFVINSKLDAVTPLTKLMLCILRLIVAIFRFDAISADGLVEEIVGP